MWLLFVLVASLAVVIAYLMALMFARSVQITLGNRTERNEDRALRIQAWHGAFEFAATDKKIEMLLEKTRTDPLNIFAEGENAISTLRRPAVLHDIFAATDLAGELRVVALRRLLELTPEPDVLGLFKEALRSKCHALIVEVLQRMRLQKSRELVDEVLPLLDLELLWEPQMHFETIQTMRHWQELRSVPRLLRLLQHSTEAVRVAAIEALGELGGVEAVPALHAAANSLATGSAARDAIKQIQSRLGPVETGSLSVAALEEGRGAVSVIGSGDDTGAVGVVDSGED